MSDNENRQIGRDSLFVLADLRIDGIEGEQGIRVRNLSSGGMMAEGSCKVLRGQLVWVNLRNLGWTEGLVAWVQDSRFGIAFRDEIDPRLARTTVSGGQTGTHTPRFVRPPLSQQESGDLRKI
ncbi:MAG: PilZ domain-containing protein [Sphingomonadales bacterium]|nr:PilZ domain-containing protein [Sphingomonadales bacterium]